MSDLKRKYPSENVCPACESRNRIDFFEMLDTPVHNNLLWKNQEAAKNCPKGNIKLSFCPVCSLITNKAFEEAQLHYSQTYDTSLHFSPYFQDYAHSLAVQLIERYELYNKDIIEIGCGKGYFLSLLSKLGCNRGIGFDPAYIEQKDDNKNDQINFIPDFYSEKYGDYQGDLIVCRQVLEHIQDPKNFLKMIRGTISNRLKTHVFFEVPNALQTFKRLFIWDIIYEHFSYFTPTALAIIFSSSGFRVCKLTEEFEGQYLCIDVIPDTRDNLNISQNQKNEVNKTANYIKSFPQKYQRKVDTWKKRLKLIEDNGQRIVIWGAGSKGVTFLNTFKNSKIKYAVDINPYKQTMYIPGTGQEIVPPKFLKNYKPDFIVIMNPIYKDEIRSIVSNLKFRSKFLYV